MAAQKLGELEGFFSDAPLDTSCILLSRTLCRVTAYPFSMHLLEPGTPDEDLVRRE